jgi:hypothetical protein
VQLADQRPASFDWEQECDLWTSGEELVSLPEVTFANEPKGSYLSLESRIHQFLILISEH